MTPSQSNQPHHTKSQVRNAPAGPPPAAIKVGDIIHALFRRKWIIVACCAVGALAALTAYVSTPKVYRSDAKLLVKYVREAKGMDAVDGNSQVKSPDSHGGNIINSELEILSSYDLAREVAETVGSAKLLQMRSSNAPAAASVILKNLVVEVPRNSDVIKVSFRHSDPEVAQTVLKALIEGYLKKHIEVHRGVGIVDSFLSQQVDQLRQKVSQTEDALRRERAKLGVISVEDAKRSYADQLSKLHQEMLGAEAELAEMRRGQPTNNIASGSTNSPAATNNVAQKEVPKDTTERYNAIRGELAAARTKEIEMSLRYTEESPALQQLRSRIQQLELSRKNLEAENPALAALPVTIPGRDKFDMPASAIALATPASLESRLRVLGAQYDKMRTEAAALDEAESAIRALQRTRDTSEANYRYFAQNLEQARLDENLDPGKMPNINKVQEATPAYPVNSGGLKTAGAFLALIVLGGLALTLFIEIVVDQSVRKPSDLEGRFHIPLWVSIPNVNGHSKTFMQRFLKLRPLKRNTPENGNGSLQAPIPGPVIRPYCEALRDRLISFFRSRNIMHIPKLIGITSCRTSSGVSVISHELAKSLSENGDGRVLLVKMDSASTTPSLVQDSRADEARLESTVAACTAVEALNAPPLLVQDRIETNHSLASLAEERQTDDQPVSRGERNGEPKLEIISVNGMNGTTEQSLRARLSGVIAKVKSSQLDFIIFDLPPLGQTSVTPFLADVLDVLMLVVEAEKTPRQSVKRALGLLDHARSPVVAILNKRQKYVPHWIEPD